MSRLFRPFILCYGLLHLAGGIVLWTMPASTGAILSEPLTAAGSSLLGFISTLAGLGFVAASYVTENRGRRAVIRLCLLGNAANLVVHVQNVFLGASPWWVAAAALLSLGSLMTCLLLMHRDISARIRGEQTRV